MMAVFFVQLLLHVALNDNTTKEHYLSCLPCSCVSRELQCYGLDVDIFPEDLTDDIKDALKAIIIGTTYMANLPPVTQGEYPSLELFSESGNMFMDCNDIQRWALTFKNTTFVTECILHESTLVTDTYTSATEKESGTYYTTANFETSAEITVAEIQSSTYYTKTNFETAATTDILYESSHMSSFSYIDENTTELNDIDNEMKQTNIVALSCSISAIILIAITILIIIIVRNKRAKRPYRSARSARGQCSLSKIYRDPNSIVMEQIGVSSV